jgi:hypothetical protein
MNLDELPVEIIAMIASFLCTADLLNFSLVSWSIFGAIEEFNTIGKSCKLLVPPPFSSLIAENSLVRDQESFLRRNIQRIGLKYFCPRIFAVVKRSPRQFSSIEIHGDRRTPHTFSRNAAKLIRQSNPILKELTVRSLDFSASYALQNAIMSATNLTRLSIRITHVQSFSIQNLKSILFNSENLTFFAINTIALSSFEESELLQFKRVANIQEVHIVDDHPSVHFHPLTCKFSNLEKLRITTAFDEKSYLMPLCHFNECNQQLTSLIIEGHAVLPPIPVRSLRHLKIVCDSGPLRIGMFLQANPNLRTADVNLPHDSFEISSRIFCHENLDSFTIEGPYEVLKLCFMGSMLFPTKIKLMIFKFGSIAREIDVIKLKEENNDEMILKIVDKIKKGNLFDEKLCI